MTGFRFTGLGFRVYCPGSFRLHGSFGLSLYPAPKQRAQSPQFRKLPYVVFQMQKDWGFDNEIRILGPIIL